MVRIPRLLQSCLTHPHFGHTEDELTAAGVYSDTLRLSIGIEDVDDLIADLDWALNMTL